MCINGTGILNAWAKKNLSAATYDEMNQLATEVSIGSQGLTILPFGNGAERILEQKDLGVEVLGLQLNIHSKAHLYRAIQEGIACSFRYGIEIMKSIKEQEGPICF